MPSLGPARVTWTLTDLSMYVDSLEQNGYVTTLNSIEEVEAFTKIVGLDLKIRPRQLVVYKK